MSAGAVRAGGVFVEIGADPRKFFSALTKVNKSLGNMGRSLASGGGRLAAAGIGMAAPIAAAVQQGAAFESTLLNIRASTGATAAQIDQIKASSMAMSQALGVGPTEAANAFMEVVKAGVPLEEALNGVAKTAVEFSKVAGMDAAEGAVILSKAMNAFGVDGALAANTLSAAADSSATTIQELSMAMSQVSAVASSSNQSIQDTAAGLALLANKGIVSSDAGTSVKTMLQRLKAPSDEATDSLRAIGLSLTDLRDASTGKLLQLPKLIGVLEKAFASVDEITKDMAIKQIFGDDAVRAGEIFRRVGEKSFTEVMNAMDKALPVGEKYKIMMSGLAGSAGNVLAALQRMAIAVSDAVAPALASVVPFITGFIDGLTKLATDNKEAVAAFAKFAVAAVAVGSAMVGLGISLQVTSFGLAGIGKAAAFALSPLTMLIGAASGVGKSFALVAMPQTLKLANTIGSSMLGASASVLAFTATAGGAMAGFATSSATALAGFAASSAAGFVRMSGAASAAAQAMFPVFFTGFNRGIAAGAGFFSATLRGLNGVVMASSTLRGAMFAVSGSGMARFVGDIVGGLTLTYKSFVWWATGASARMAQYAANLTGAAGKTIASTAAMSAAWLGSAARGVAAFVGSAVAGIGTYLGAAAMAVAGSVASAAAVAAAWLAPLAPVALLVAAVAGAGAAIYAFRGTISSAFSSVAGYVTEAGSAIAGGFSTAVSDGIVVLGDLAATAMTTFNGIYEAVAAGDLSGAMDVLWAGLIAGWLRGTEALMSYVDSWVAAFQDVFTDVGSGIVIAWDKLYTDSSAILNTMGAFIMGFFDNIANSVMATFDNLVAGIQIAWTRVKGYITGAKDTKERVQKIRDENAARAEQRMQERPGIESRTGKADEQNRQAERDRMGRASAVQEGAAEDKAARQVESQRRADDRRAATEAAEGALSYLTSSKQAERDAAKKAAEEIASATGASAASPGEKAATAGAGAATVDSATSKADVAGTFSSVNLGGMGFGSSLQERMAKATEATAKGVGELVAQGGGKVAA
jgi:TP901 family phage tail tape measure protein